MKKPFKILLKIVGVLFVFILILCIWLFFGIKNAYKEVYTKENIKEIITAIKQAPPIPDDFKLHVELVYPSIFKMSINKHTYNSFFNDYKTPCPSRDIAYQFHWRPKKWTFFSGTIPFSLAWCIEGKVTQEECFAYEIVNFDFMNNQKGIYNASQYYYGKDLRDLSAIEQYELIIMMKNPGYYNKKRFPKRLEKEAKMLYNEIEKRLGANNYILHNNSKFCPLSCFLVSS